MSIDLQPLITPAVAIAFFGGMYKLLTDLLNHKSTENFDKQTETLSTKLDEGFKQMGSRFDAMSNKGDENTNKIVSAILSSKQ